MILNLAWKFVRVLGTLLGLRGTYYRFLNSNWKGRESTDSWIWEEQYPLCGQGRFTGLSRSLCTL